MPSLASSAVACASALFRTVTTNQAATGVGNLGAGKLQVSTRAPLGYLIDRSNVGALHKMLLRSGRSKRSRRWPPRAAAMHTYAGHKFVASSHA